MKDYEYDTQVIEAAEAFVEASTRHPLIGHPAWRQYLALRQAVSKRNAALVESQA